MKKITLLFLDYGIPELEIGETIANEQKLILFDFRQELRSLFHTKEGELYNKMNQFLINGELLPSFLIEEFLEKSINTIKEDNILLTGFPKSKEQSVSLEKITKSLGIHLESIWYIKQRLPEVYYQYFFNDPTRKKWVEKYGTEVIDNAKAEFIKRRSNTQNIIEKYSIIKKQIIEVDYDTNIPEIIKEKIKESA